MVQKRKNAAPCNPNAQECVHRVLEYLADSAGKRVITGQHTQTRQQKELAYIQKITGKLPALCGFELLSYSPNINYESGDEECRKEIDENKGTLENAWQWAEKGGLITMTWHWFSPLYGRDKSFFTKNTEYDASLAVQAGTKEQEALFADMDAMAEYLRPFGEKQIPILFRPFHEAEGDWFWWGAKGGSTARALYRLLYDRFTNFHQLNHLIWVWNSPVPEDYPGDDTVDVLTRDLYPPAHQHTDLKKEYEELHTVLDKNPALSGGAKRAGAVFHEKLMAVAEIGTLPSVTALAQSRVPWSWYMTWSNEFGGSAEYTSEEKLKEFYECEYAVTLDRLPCLY